MNMQELHERAVREFGRRVELVDDDQWANRTPNTEWNVHALVNHLVNEDRWTPPLMAGKTIDEVGDRFDGDLLGDDPKGAWDEASREAVAAIREPGALERTVHLSFGDHRGEDYAWQLFVDHLVHAWDLARGIGADAVLDPELVEVCYERSKPQEDALKSFGVFGEKIEPPPGADMQTKLLAVFGRTA
ncbi:maleylpyruvate isomerase family mycothiol-dependent enzyme [soil metagenome]